MSSDEVRAWLREMRTTHSVGAILGILAEVVREEADVEFGDGDMTAEEQSQLVVSALFAVGLGLDAIRRCVGGTP
jgi:hypothetical protein